LYQLHAIFGRTDIEAPPHPSCPRVLLSFSPSSLILPGAQRDGGRCGLKASAQSQVDVDAVGEVCVAKFDDGGLRNELLGVKLNNESRSVAPASLVLECEDTFPPPQGRELT
jgi:hypothetical protein